MNELALLLDLSGNSEETKLYWNAQWFVVWCLQRQRNGGLNSGQKSANIVTDAFYHLIWYKIWTMLWILFVFQKWGKRSRVPNLWQTIHVCKICVTATGLFHRCNKIIRHTFQVPWLLCRTLIIAPHVHLDLCRSTPAKFHSNQCKDVGGVEKTN